MKINEKIIVKYWGFEVFLFNDFFIFEYILMGLLMCRVICD